MTPPASQGMQVTSGVDRSHQRLERTGARIVAGTWGCAAITMAASAANAALTYGALGNNRALGLATGVAVDIGLCVALIGDRQLYAHGLSSSWGRALRMTTAVMSLILNVGISIRDGHYFAALLHSFLPVLLIVLCEYGQDVLLQFTALRRERETTQQAPTASTPVAEPEPVVELPAPTYARVGPSSWTAPAAPVWRSVMPEPVADPEPVPEPAAWAAAEVVEPEPTLQLAPEPVPVPQPEVTVPLVEQQATEVEETPPERTRVSGGELDAVIARILDKKGDGIGRRRITAMLPEPRPSDHAVKTALARVRAAREPALNGAGRPAAGGESAGGGPDGG